jgi:hypothetical protein
LLDAPAMKALHVALLLSSLAFASACAAPPNEDSSESSESAVKINGVELGERWRAVVQCDGAHVDTFDEPGYGYLKQVVVTDPAAAGWLRGKLDDAAKNDPFSPNMAVGGAVRPSKPGEIVLYFIDSSDPHRDFLFSSGVTSVGAIRVDVQRFSWEREESPGLFRKMTDMKIRFVRNGYREVECSTDNGMGGGYDSYTYCNPTGGGWNEWEIANWIFRGCRSL